jgi:tRNA pseudouridine38-40 synthase
MKIALALEYDGRAFCGWQSQPAACGIQDALEAALARIAGERIQVMAAGRTDAAVHASYQVVHFSTQAKRPLTAWVRGVNTFLPSGVAVLWAREMPQDFHARFCAEARGYRYVLLGHQVRPGLLAGRVGWHHRPLDALVMQRSAELLLGEHDFSAFRAAECQARSPVKNLHLARVSVRGEFFLFEFRGNGFLHHMVRNLVGSLIHVGAGAADEQWFADLLQSRDRTRAAPTFMPDGLYLEHIRYPSRFSLPDSGRELWPS